MINLEWRRSPFEARGHGDDHAAGRRKRDARLDASKGDDGQMIDGKTGAVQGDPAAFDDSERIDRSDRDRHEKRTGKRPFAFDPLPLSIV
jgi:hypothetical protein